MHTVEFTEESIRDLKSLPDDALNKFKRNFLDPIRNGYEPEELPGRYKASWEAARHLSTFHAVFTEKAKQLNLWHYHFGYKEYKQSDNVDYPGMVSDAIVHTIRQPNEVGEIHQVVQICLEHPSPFKIPWERVSG